MRVCLATLLVQEGDNSSSLEPEDSGPVHEGRGRGRGDGAVGWRGSPGQGKSKRKTCKRHDCGL